MTNKPCPHKLLRKQLSGTQEWYVCECGQKFLAMQWSGKVRVIKSKDAEQWAADYFALEQEDLIEKYDLDCQLGESTLAALFRAFGGESQ